MQICNFEVDFEEEEEIRFAGGVKGLRALKQQRDLIEKEIGNDEVTKQDLAAVSGNKFADHEQDQPEIQPEDKGADKDDVASVDSLELAM